MLPCFAQVKRSDSRINIVLPQPLLIVGDVKIEFSQKLDMFGFGYQCHAQVDLVVACQVDLGELAVQHIERRVIWRVVRPGRHQQVEEALRATKVEEVADVHVANALRLV
mgnify:CR=1 FL=1